MFDIRLSPSEILKALVLQSSEPSECNRSITENGPGELLSSLSSQESSPTDSQASQGDGNAFDNLKAIVGKLPIGGNDDAMNNGQDMQAQSKAYHFDPDNIAPPEVQRQLFGLLKWRDGVYRDVVAKIEMVPGLSDLLDELTNALNACATFLLPK